MRKKRKSKKYFDNNSIEIWTEEQYEEYLKGIYGIEFIAGFTENVIPYGLFKEDLETYTAGQSDNCNEIDDELPF